MNHVLLLVLQYRGLQGHIWRKGQRANNVLSQITFNNCKRNAQTLSNIDIYYSPGTWCSIRLLIKFHSDPA